MDIPAPDQHQELREALRDLCKEYPDEYWRKLDYEREFPVAPGTGDTGTAQEAPTARAPASRSSIPRHAAPPRRRSGICR